MKYPFIVLIILSLSSCKKKDPVACIDSVPLIYEVGDELNVSATCSEGVSFNWAFGDGASAKRQTAKHIYGSSGDYKLELTAYSKKEKKSDAISKIITVNSKPVGVTIVYVELMSFPQSDAAGNQWDSDMFPDVFLTIFDANNNYVTGGEVQQNAVFNQSYTYFNDFPVTLPYVNEQFIGVYDKDITSDQLMDFISFTPSKHSLSQPNSIELNQDGYQLRLQLEWVY